MNDRTKEILRRFAESWQSTEALYDDLINNYNWEKLVPVRQFISELKEKGEDKYFRLGTSTYILLISRSVEHGLRPDQKYIWIDAIDMNDYEIKFRDGNKTYREYRIKDLQDARLMKLIETLRHTLVD